jgi:hypothetical protein
MAIPAALLLAAAPLAEALPHGVTLLAGVRAEIIRAERVVAVTEKGGVQRTVSPERDGVVVQFD